MLTKVKSPAMRGKNNMKLMAKQKMLAVETYRNTIIMNKEYFHTIHNLTETCALLLHTKLKLYSLNLQKSCTNLKQKIKDG